MTLDRRQVLAGGLATAISSPVFATPRLHYDLVPIQVGNGVWMIEGKTEYFSADNGGAIVNCSILQGDDGMIIVDSGPSLRYGEALVRAVSQLSANPIAAVINTHHHPDHFLGNQVFEETPILALGETISLAETHGNAFADNMYQLLGDWMRGTEPRPPTQAVEGGELTINGRTFDMIPLAGHTEADLAILDKTSGTLIAGDLAFFERAPTTPSADLKLWQQSIDFLTEINAHAIIPGHGPIDRTHASLRQTSDYLTWLDALLRRSAADGLDMVEIMDLKLPLHFARMGAMPQEFHRSVAHLFPDIEKSILPKAN